MKKSFSEICPGDVRSPYREQGGSPPEPRQYSTSDRNLKLEKGVGDLCKMLGECLSPGGRGWGRLGSKGLLGLLKIEVTLFSDSLRGGS